jgi:DNA-binding MarR family transcriptional regulator
MTTKNRAALCPDGRISVSTKSNDGREVVDIDSYIPYLLVAVNNTLSRGASQYYLEYFGVGIVEWRVISMLAIEPKITASRICDIISLDKAATSRALKQLQDKAYASFKTSSSDNRRKIWCLSSKGYRLHDKILEIALEREKQLISGISPTDLEAFLRAMRVMLKNVKKI